MRSIKQLREDRVAIVVRSLYEEQEIDKLFKAAGTIRGHRRWNSYPEQTKQEGGVIYYLYKDSTEYMPNNERGMEYSKEEGYILLEASDLIKNSEQFYEIF